MEEFKYLGYIFKKNNRNGAHIKEVIKRAAAMAQMWGIEERKFDGDYRRRMMMFNAMVTSIVIYDVEIYGWKE